MKATSETTSTTPESKSCTTTFPSPRRAELESLLFTEDVADSKEHFTQEYGERPLGAFIRSITGLNQHTLNETFAESLQVGHLRADQVDFIKTIISYLSKNGVIDKAMLLESPFTDIHDQCILGSFLMNCGFARWFTLLMGLTGMRG